ncbi:Uncharacterized membrane protein [Parasphingorhabdus marina DSM 22363]|uniref:Uncharacterized membrane protein n=1 Tax=Parasphingorhabdus marina DSM 22363 TaxID=1123272 RepID=A0A1N6EMR2_9SPHN|nr:DoxX family protein [Parasphingorhabdus marina]SIN84334.1 Uncharacterized membrane protein [Parasphingorhabdus marina DSM 22363]
MTSRSTQDSYAIIFFRLLLSVFYIAAGILHIKSPAGFLAITPDWVPFPEQAVFWTGVAELTGGLGLLVSPKWWPGIRYAAGIGLAVYAVCVFPANINHAINDIAIDGTALGWAYHGPRLLFQPVFVWWALVVGGVTRWPFK